MYTTLAQIKTANKRAGCHFFDKESMNFFNSSPEPTVYGGRSFIDSIQYDEESARTFNVWRCNPSGTIDHMWPEQFDGTNTDRAQAVAVAEALAAQ